VRREDGLSAGPITGAESLALSLVTLLATIIVVAYLTDRLGLPIAPRACVAAGILGAAIVMGVAGRRAQWDVGDVVLFVVVVVATLAYLLWVAWPSLLPRGSGPDLTHHLVLVDYIEQRWQLPHDAAAGAHLGEMAHYTPGMHLVAAISGAVFGTNGLHAIYPIVAASVALKFGSLLLILLRVLHGSVAQRALALTSVPILVLVPAYSFGSFMHDAFLAQVVGELFAVSMWWSQVAWDARPNPLLAAHFGVAGAAAFLTWPVWVGPPILALLVMALVHRDVSMPVRLRHVLIAVAPIAAAATAYASGRLGWLALAGVSGAVMQPTLDRVGWALTLVSAVGVVITIADRRYRATNLLVAALMLQTAALWFLARRGGAATPYMAIKMLHLAIYPAAVAVVGALARLWELIVRSAAPTTTVKRAQAVTWCLVGLLVFTTSRRVLMAPPPASVVSDALAAAGGWAREHVPAHCVDYLVGNEYTAYWLHLAVLRNSRASARTGDDTTFLTQPSMARWLAAGGLPYAIVDLNVVPLDILSNVDVIQRFDHAAVIARRGSSHCP